MPTPPGAASAPEAISEATGEARAETASGAAGAPAAPRPPAAAPGGQPWWRLRRTDLLALLVWVASRVVMLVISLAALADQHGTSWLGLWQRWDWDRYLTVAEYGYTSGKGPAYDANIVAFFPGYPMVLRAVHLVVRDWAASGLLISLVAGAVACIALARLTEVEWRARSAAREHAAGEHGAAQHAAGEHSEGDRSAPGGSGRVVVTAVLLLVCAPAAVFLAAGYTESLFLALGIPAWYAARRRRWVLACVLTALACTVRIDGVFEAAGIGVMFLLSRPKARDWARLPAFALPLAAVAGYFAYLDDIKGSWLAWFTAEGQGWSRELTNPITAFRNSWSNAFGAAGPKMGAPGAGLKGGGGSGARRFGAQPGGVKPGKAGSLPGAGQAGGQAGGPGGGQAGGQAGGLGGGQAGGHGGGTALAQGQHASASGGFSHLAGTGTFGPWPFRLDIPVVFVGLAFLGWAAFRRRWAELVYVGIAVVSLATSTYYMSVAREALLWWPLLIAFALWLSSRRRWLTGLWTVASAAMMVGISWLFLTGGWAG